MMFSLRPHSLLLVVVAAAAGGSQPVDAVEPVPERHFSATTPAEVEAWQQESRTLLFDLLKMSDLVAAREKSLEAIPFEVKELSSTDHDSYTLKEIEINSTSTRRIKALVTLPKGEAKDLPAVVCIHGHGGSRQIVYEPESLYRGFATKLAGDGYVTISTDVGQHEVYEEGRTLMGERLWDVMRCADYVATLDRVDDEQLGCAGLSLGGEMAMWLGAMDPRMKVTVSSGFLTSVENMRNRHCPCWDFPGLTENFTFSDIYSLIAPRALQCQIGALERAPGGFPAAISHHEMGDIQRAYAVFNRGHLAQLEIHNEGHVFKTPSGCAFIDRHLKPRQ